MIPKPNDTDLIKQFIAESAFSRSTQVGYGDKLIRLAAWLEAHDSSLKRMTTTQFIQFLDELGWNDNGRYAMFNAARSFLHWSVGPRNALTKLKIRRGKPKPQRTLDENQVLNVLSGLDTNTIGGIRNLAMIALFIDTGIRRCEAARAQVQYLNMKERRLEVETKGGEWGSAVFTPYTASCLQDWLALRERIQNQVNVHDDHLFISIRGKTAGRAFSSRGIQKEFERISKRTGIEFSSHALRRTFATLSLKRGASTRLVQVAGRWKTLSMVERYTQAINAEDMQPFSPIDGIMNSGNEFSPKPRRDDNEPPKEPSVKSENR